VEKSNLSGVEGQGTEGESGSDPSLVLIGQSGAWTKKQKRQYQRCLSWQTEKTAAGLQLFRVDLTTANGGPSHLLRVHFKELKRRVLRVYGYDVDHFSVETSEGNGVLHMLWAIQAEKAAWIDQPWISEQWEKIHGAKIVIIKRVRNGKSDRRRIAKYLVSQYLSNQGEHGLALVRFSYSWWKSQFALGRGWAVMKREFRFARYRLERARRRDDLTLDRRRDELDFRTVIDAWNELLSTGRCTLAGVALCVYQRRVMTVTAAAQEIFG